MIVSASRRADIPAHYADWFMNRVRAGWCAVPSPFNARQVSRVSLEPAAVDAIVFWTRDPSPLLGRLPELRNIGFEFVFQFTLLEYPPALHPGMPPLPSRLDAFRKLSDLIGPERVLWRYDPVVLTASIGTDFHRRWFERLSRELAGHTRRVTVSLVEPYRKTLSRMKRAGADLLAPDEASLEGLFTFMSQAARDWGMTPVSCADEAGLDGFGFVPGACVDAELLSSVTGRLLPPEKDPNQRPACRCAKSRDIGMYDACPAGCAYCYATRDFASARLAHAAHDPGSPSLTGRHEPSGDQHRLPIP
ncbi:MAG: DUF1848 domain-containing protein [Thermodesulfobacteriota bacterium]